MIVAAALVLVYAVSGARALAPVVADLLEALVIIAVSVSAAVAVGQVTTGPIRIGISAILTLVVLQQAIDVLEEVPALAGVLGDERVGGVAGGWLAALIVGLVSLFAVTAYLIRRTLEARRSRTGPQRSERELPGQRSSAIREQERKRVARDVHDQLGSLLTRIKYDATRIMRRTTGCGAEIRTVLELADQAIGRVQEIAADLRPAVLEVGIVAAIENDLAAFGRRTGTECEADISGSLDTALTDDGAAALFGIYQEAITNVERHAAATRITVRAIVSRGWIALEVRDNGVGLGAQVARAPRSHGLRGMRERALEVGGTVLWGTTGHHGTVVRARIPERGSSRPVAVMTEDADL